MGEGHRYDRRTVIRRTLAAASGAAIGGALPASAAAAHGHGHGGSGHPPGARPRRCRAAGLRGRGVVFDTGFVNGASTTREPFDPQVVKREMQLIRHELGCNAVRVWGGIQDRLEIAARHAAQAGLEVWYGPFTTDLTAQQMLAFLADAAERCERLRRSGSRVVLMLGAELGIFQKGFLPGETWQERVAALTPTNPQLPQLLAELPAKLDAFFAQAVPLVRARFRGPISYASLAFERIDWSPFDYVGHDFYPNLVGGEYVGAADAIASLQSHGKPVVICETGCPAYEGAAARAGHASDAIVVWDEATGRPAAIRGDPVRDEGEQSEYLLGLLDLLDGEGVDSAFVYTLGSYHFRGEFDIASFGVARVLPEGDWGETYPGVPWEPKQAFHDLAARYTRHRGRRGNGRRG